MGIREDEKIAPHCEFIHVHDKVVKRVMDVMPEGEELQNPLFSVRQKPC